MSSSYGLAGTDPLTDFEKSVHVLLKEAVRDNWDSTIGLPTPDYDPNDYESSDYETTIIESDIAASKIRFTNTWFTGSGDKQIAFLGNSVSRPPTRRSIDMKSMIPVQEFVDVHVFARAKGADSEPENFHKLISTLRKLIELNRTTLLPHNAYVTVEQGRRVPEQDNLRNVWHYTFTVVVRYYKTAETVIV